MLFDLQAAFADPARQAVKPGLCPAGGAGCRGPQAQPLKNRRPFPWERGASPVFLFFCGNLGRRFAGPRPLRLCGRERLSAADPPSKYAALPSRSGCGILLAAGGRESAGPGPCSRRKSMPRIRLRAPKRQAALPAEPERKAAAGRAQQRRKSRRQPRFLLCRSTGRLRPAFLSRHDTLSKGATE